MVAANLPLSKIKKIGNQKVVKASWITERFGIYISFRLMNFVSGSWVILLFYIDLH